MCGIAGFVKQRNVVIGADKLEQLLLQLQNRGHDATGLAYRNDGHIVVCKRKGTASQVLKDATFRKQLARAGESPWALFHCRQATNGSPNKSCNNHPIWSDKGLIIHNGVVWDVPAPITKVGNTDTEDLLRYLDTKGFSGLNEISGTAAFGYVKFEHPESIYIYTHLAPLAFTANDDAFFFASISNMLTRFDKAVGFVVPNTVFELKQGQAIKIGEYHPKVNYNCLLDNSWLKETSPFSWKKWLKNRGRHQISRKTLQVEKDTAEYCEGSCDV